MAHVLTEEEKRLAVRKYGVLLPRWTGNVKSKPCFEQKIWVVGLALKLPLIGFLSTWNKVLF
jgi:hypothetical protein